MDLDTNTLVALYGLIFKDENPTWTKDQIKEHLDKRFIFNSRYINNLLRKTLSPDPKSQDSCCAPPDRDFETKNRGRFTRNREDFATNTGSNYDNQNRGSDTNHGNRGYYPNNDWNEPASRLNRVLTNSMKMYIEKLQYRENVNFDQKIKIFHNLCNCAGIPRIA